MRMISTESKSMVYHRPQCRYAKRMNRKNRMQMYWYEAEKQGYRPCKCCDAMKFLYSVEEADVGIYGDQHNLDVDLVEDEIIIRTDVGCWKILYKKDRQKFVLLHRNYAKGRVPLEDVNKAPFHYQKDFRSCGSIIPFVKYIKAHDEYKANPVASRDMPQRTERQKSYYRSAKRRENKRAAQRLDALFRMIECKEGIKQLSFC